MFCEVILYTMKTALIIYKFFARGGAQRDLVRTAKALLERNAQVEVICAECHDQLPEGCQCTVLPVKGSSNHCRMKHFEAAVKAYLSDHPADAVLGFARMGGLDLYFAADDCLRKRWKNAFLNLILPRRRTFLQLEKAALQSPAVLSLTARQERDYQFYYQVNKDLFKRMPTGIDRKYQTFKRDASLRERVRQKYSISAEQILKTNHADRCR